MVRTCTVRNDTQAVVEVDNQPAGHAATLNLYEAAKRPPGLVAHEAVHVAAEILRRRKKELSDDNEETLADLVQEIVHELTKRL